MHMGRVYVEKYLNDDPDMDDLSDLEPEIDDFLE